MEFQELVRARHSVRDFSPEPVDRAAIERIIAVAELAPSSANEQPWRFFVASGESRHALGMVIAQTTMHLAEYFDASDSKAYDQAARWYSYLGNAPTLIAVTSPNSEDPLSKLNRYLSVGAAVENILLAAVDEGLGACNITFSHWVEDEIADLLGLPDDWDVLTIIAIGKPGSVPPRAPSRRADDTVWSD